MPIPVTMRSRVPTSTSGRPGRPSGSGRNPTCTLWPLTLAPSAVKPPPTATASPRTIAPRRRSTEPNTATAEPSTSPSTRTEPNTVTTSPSTRSPGPTRASENSRPIPLPLPFPCTTIGPPSKSPPIVTALLSVSRSLVVRSSIGARWRIRRCRAGRASCVLVALESMPASAGPPGTGATAASTQAAASAATANLEDQQADIGHLRGGALLARVHPPQQRPAHGERGEHGDEHGGMRERVSEESQQPAGTAAAGEGHARAREPVAQRAQHERPGAGERAEPRRDHAVEPGARRRQQERRDDGGEARGERAGVGPAQHPDPARQPVRQHVLHDAVEQLGARVQERQGAQLAPDQPVGGGLGLALAAGGDVRGEALRLGGGGLAVQPILKLARLDAAIHDGPWMRSLSSARARWIRAFTVPSGRFSASAISSYDKSCWWRNSTTIR